MWSAVAASNYLARYSSALRCYEDQEVCLSIDMKARIRLACLWGLLAIGLFNGCATPQTQQNQQKVQNNLSNPPVGLSVTNGVASGQPERKWIRFYARAGSRMRIDGTANMLHTHWRVESPIIVGRLEADPNFPTNLAQASFPLKVEVKGDAFIPVISLKSIDDEGAHFSDAMDNVMYDRLKAARFHTIEYHLTELVLQKPAQGEGAPYLFDAKGELVVAGVTNALSMPITVLPLADQKLRLSGATAMKMTGFGIEPPGVLGEAIKAGDEVKLSFDWVVSSKRAPSVRSGPRPQRVSSPPLPSPPLLPPPPQPGR
jgi:hypothetical protein